MTVSLNGNKLLEGYDPEFFNVTALDPRVTLRKDSTKGPRRRSSSVRRYTTTPTGGLTVDEVRKRSYVRGW